MLWLRRLLPKKASPSRVNARGRTFRPCLEILEDRQLLSINPAMAVPTLISPSGTAPALPTFQWSPVAGATGYNVWLADETTQQVVANGVVNDTSTTLQSALTTGDKYE